MKQLFILFYLLPLLASSQTTNSIDSKIKNMKAYPGFVDFFWDDSTGKIWMKIDKLDTALLYQTSLPAGIGSNDISLDRGIMGTTYIVQFNRVGNKILMTEPNFAYRAVSGDAAEKRAVEQSFAQSVIWGFTIATAADGAYLVDATDFLLRDALQVSNRLLNTKQGIYVMDATRSAMYLPRTKNFPLNTEMEATITFVNKDGKTGAYINSVAPAAEAVTVRMHHSFVQLPDDKNRPRKYDARSPFITSSYFDYSTPVAEPIQKDFIIRHRLIKKDPLAAKSEAVKPIIYYLDNGTPEPIRTALMKGAGWWNQAFEAAGFINAFQVKILPDSADPMDMRYNMINWVHRSTRGWSFGNAVVDPRTGEILKGNVTLGSLRVRQDYLIAQGLLSPFANDSITGDDKLLGMALQRLQQLAAHEVGHTIGLMHNYISSAQVNTSVMDYPHPMVSMDDNNHISLNNAYTNEIGEWDKISIMYGYSQFLPGTNEAAALNNLLMDAAGKGLTFISDRDARDAGGMNPNAHLWDNGKDPVSGLRDVMKIRKAALAQFGLNSIRKGTPMAMLEDVLVPIYLFHRYQIEAATKVVGGIFYNYAIKGDGQFITKTVSKQEQQQALDAIISCIDPEFLTIPESITKLIPPRPAGYEYNRELFNRRTGLSFDPLAAAETAADMPLSFLFNSSRLNRMVQQKETGTGLGVDEMIQTLITKTWKAPRLKGMQGLVQKQNEQLLLTYLLAVSLNNEASFATKACMQNALDQIKTFADSQLKTNKVAVDKGHFELTLERIKNPLEAKPTLHSVAPPGSPIGCY